MNEVKSPKKPLIYYYGIVLLVLMVFNFLAMPWLAQRQIQAVDYNTFLTMTEEGQIGRVARSSSRTNRILFTDKERDRGCIKPAMVSDPDLTQSGCMNAGAPFYRRRDPAKLRPLLSFLLSWVLPHRDLRGHRAAVCPKR